MAAGRDIDTAIKASWKERGVHTRVHSWPQESRCLTTWKRCYRVSVHRAPALTADRAETFTASVPVNRRGSCRFYLLAPRPRRNPPSTGVAATQVTCISAEPHDLSFNQPTDSQREQCR